MLRLSAQRRNGHEGENHSDEVCNNDCEEHDCSPPIGYNTSSESGHQIPCGPDAADLDEDIDFAFTGDEYWIPYQLEKLVYEAERLKKTEKARNDASVMHAMERLIKDIKVTLQIQSCEKLQDVKYFLYNRLYSSPYA